MIPRPVHAPPVQAARSAVGFLPPRPESTLGAVRPLPPEPSRIEHRPVVLDQWGRTTLAGAGEERIAVPTPAGGGTSSGILWLALGYVAASLLSR